MFAHTVTRRGMRKLTAFLGLIVLAAALFCYPDAVKTGAARGMALCGTVILPSLFPFMVIVGVFTRSAMAGAVSRVLARPMMTLFRLSGSAAVAVVAGLLGGYPAGSAAVRDLLSRGEITPKEGERLLHFAVNAGPAFAVSAVGAGMLGDTRRGWLLFAASTLAAVCIGFAEARGVPKSAVRVMPPKSQPLSAAFTGAVDAACGAMVSLCGYVILFAVVLAVADGSGATVLFNRLLALPMTASGGRVSSSLPSFLPAILEVSSGCLELAGKVPPFVLAFFMCFGGVSVHCQVKSLAPACTRHFFAYRLLHGMLGGVFAAVLFYVVPLSAPTALPSETRLQLFTVSPLASLACLCMCLAFLLQKRIDKSTQI